MKLSRNLSLYWRLLVSYLLVIGVGCVTLFLSGETFGPFLLERHVASMQQTMHNLTPETFRAAMASDLGDAYRRALSQSLLWSLLGPGGRADFIAEYGPLTAAQRLRARVLAIFLSAVLALYGHREGMAALRDEALLGLERTSTPAG